MVHNQTNANRNGETHHVPTPLHSRMVPWFIIKQTRTEMIIPVSRAKPPTVLLENGFMVHNQTNADKQQKLSATFLREWYGQGRPVYDQNG